MTDLPLRAGDRDPAAPVLGHHGHLTALYLQVEVGSYINYPSAFRGVQWYDALENVGLGEDTAAEA